MSEGESSRGILDEIREIFLFLTKGEPSPDDEIEAREELIIKFKNLNQNSFDPERKTQIEGILKKLENWDTLDLWFLETSIPGDIENLLNIPAQVVDKDQEIARESSLVEEDDKPQKSDIDIGDIIDKVSQQFKGEIDVLKDTIENLKKELDKKEAAKEISHKKVQKITPKKHVRLPPPKIKIPVIKKVAPPEKEKIAQSVPPVPDVTPKVKTTPIQSKQLDKSTQDLTPIPTKPEELETNDKENKELTPIPTKKAGITTEVIEESKDRPLINEKIRVSTVVREKSDRKTKEEKEREKTFIAEKPRISSVKVEEVETGTIKSSGVDLFDVFSSVGENGKSSEEKKEKSKDKETEEKKKHVKKSSPQPETEKVKPDPNNSIDMSSFVGFKTDSSLQEPRKTEDLPNDKDALYQELIALEGKRYAIEKRFKELETSYNKGSISEMQYKNSNDEIKMKMQDITTQINTIRRLISTL